MSSVVVPDALRLLDRQDRVDEVKLEALRAAVQQGRDDIEASRATSIGDEDQLKAFFAEL
jgi:Arc/MetJ-type ribon-helix-helix transcriptional regulator